MGIFNLLDVSTNFIDFAVDPINIKSLNWIGKIVQWLVEGVGMVGLGVILFTLILKTVVLPLDVYSRVKMKKQSLLMESMRPQMEKLQKQYANDKAMYSQKVMELQKANGISMFGACLPMIVTLIIFMVVFNSFSTYSQYANLSTYNDMVNAYNISVNEYVIDEEGTAEQNANCFLIAKTDESLGVTAYLVDFEAFKKLTNAEGFDTKSEAEKMSVVRNYVREHARKASSDYYRANRTDFFWVGNIWYPDSLLNKEVPDFSKFSSAITRATGSGLDNSYEESYDEVTHYLRWDGYKNDSGKLEGNTYNGYFVLIVLAIGLMFLQQFISMRSQKASNELATVDGSGAKTNKWMLIMMPVIYGVFSFFYSAAFSLYMITSTLYGLITTVIINKIMDASFSKHGAQKFASKGGQNNRKRLK